MKKSQGASAEAMQGARGGGAGCACPRCLSVTRVRVRARALVLTGCDAVVLSATVGNADALADEAGVAVVVMLSTESVAEAAAGAAGLRVSLLRPPSPPSAAAGRSSAASFPSVVATMTTVLSDGCCASARKGRRQGMSCDRHVLCATVAGAWGGPCRCCGVPTAIHLQPLRHASCRNSCG